MVFDLVYKSLKYRYTYLNIYKENAVNIKYYLTKNSYKCFKIL